MVIVNGVRPSRRFRFRLRRRTLRRAREESAPGASRDVDLVSIGTAHPVNAVSFHLRLRASPGFDR